MIMNQRCAFLMWNLLKKKRISHLESMSNVTIFKSSNWLIFILLFELNRKTSNSYLRVSQVAWMNFQFMTSLNEVFVKFYELFHSAGEIKSESSWWNRLVLKKMAKHPGNNSQVKRRVTLFIYKVFIGWKITPLT